LDRVLRYFEEPSRLPPARGIALFACRTLDLFDVLPLSHVHRSRLDVAPVPLVRELVALDEEVGTILVVACDRTGARFFEVTAYGVVELPSLTACATRPGECHGARQAKEERERAWDRAHAEAVREGVATGWAVNGVEPTLRALERGQVRTLLADGQDDDRRIDDAVEEALAQRVQVDVVYDERARRVVDGLAGLLRFRR